MSLESSWRNDDGGDAKAAEIEAAADHAQEVELRLFKKLASGNPVDLSHEEAERLELLRVRQQNDERPTPAKKPTTQF